MNRNRKKRAGERIEDNRAGRGRKGKRKDQSKGNIYRSRKLTIHLNRSYKRSYPVSDM
jgi:hypothetical protein